MSKSTIIKKISYSVFANVISLLVSIFMVIIVPKFLSLEDYGLWQLFLFYYSYMAFILDTQGILLKHWIPSFLQGNYMESLCFSFLFQLLFLLVLCGLLMTLSSSVSFGVSSSLSHSLILTMPVIRLCSLLTASNGMPHSCCWKERSCFRPSSYALQPASAPFLIYILQRCFPLFQSLWLERIGVKAY